MNIAQAIVLLIFIVIAEVLLGVLSNWIYEQLKRNRILSDNLSAGGAAVVIRVENGTGVDIRIAAVGLTEK